MLAELETKIEEESTLAEVDSSLIDLSGVYAKSCQIPDVKDTGMLPVVVVQSIAIHVSAQ